MRTSRNGSGETTLGGRVTDALWRLAVPRERQELLQSCARWLRLGLPARHRFGLVDRPAYAYGVRKAVAEASRLGHCGVTVAEFGVAGGNGLLALAEYARYFGAASGVQVDVVGFDLGDGLPAPADHRDLPYMFGEGFYAMDQDELAKRLGPARLIIGDVAETVPAFLAGSAAELGSHPIGFLAFDMDYYSSTLAALTALGEDVAAQLLPRILCYFDDLLGLVGGIGEFAALADFNAEHRNRFAGPIFGLRGCVPFSPPWADHIYQLHLFDHPDYHRHQPDLVRDQLPLRTAAG